MTIERDGNLLATLCFLKPNSTSADASSATIATEKPTRYPFSPIKWTAATNEVARAAPTVLQLLILTVSFVLSSGSVTSAIRAVKVGSVIE